MNQVKRALKLHLKNAVGVRVYKRYIIFESDDWGSIRMPSLQARDRLAKRGLNLGDDESKRYNNTDTLADTEDFEALFSVLRSFKDSKGNHPVFTALSLVANPDFEKIEKNKFENYFFEPFTATLSKYNRTDALRCWEEGFNDGIFIPEFHGREHLNVCIWMRSLQKNWPDTIASFKEEVWGFQETKLPPTFSYQAAFHLEEKSDLETQKNIISSGLKLFKQIHGREPSYFVAPNGYFNNHLEESLLNNGIRYIGAQKIQKEPLGDGKFQKNFHWLGKKNRLGQLYITRNAFFEPNAPASDWVNSCLKEIQVAFKWKKPAIISTHRTNYIGSLNEENRTNSLNMLSTLLAEILRRWPDVEFVSSSKLGKILSEKQ